MPNASSPVEAGRALSSAADTLRAAIAALDAQRPLLGDAVVDLALAPLRGQLDALSLPLSAPLPAPRPAPQSTAAPQRLKLVSILFLDVVGSTSLSQHLDPEDIHALMDGCLALCTAHVERQGGMVLQYAGDSLLAVFGAGQAQEDDAERAVRAGLALLDEGQRQGAAVAQSHGHGGFGVRVGIHTGQVLLGGGVDADGSIRGIAVNIAARMEQTAPPGHLRISRNTQRLVRGLFEMDPQPAIAVKGIDTMIESWLVRRGAAAPGPMPTRGLGVVTDAVPLVGREADLARLVLRVDEVRRVGRVRPVVLTADAGVGKSRLLGAFEAELARTSGVTFLRGRAQRHGIDEPYGVLRSLLRSHCDILDSDAADLARAKLVGRTAAVLGARVDEQAALMGQLIGLDFSDDVHIAGIARDGRQIRARAFHALEQYLKGLAAGAVCVLLFDDLHWADDGSLDFIDHLVATAEPAAVLVLISARPTVYERRPAWQHAIAAADRLELGLLSPGGAESLLSALLARLPDPPPALSRLVLDQAEGNPFHLEELLGMLIDDGVVVTSETPWRIDASRLVGLKMPATLTALLQARLDALPAAERLALQHDSVIGHVFWDDALRHVSTEAVDALPALVARTLIRRRETSVFDGMAEYAFKHHLLHQATYDTVLKALKRDSHRRVADWLIARSSARADEPVGLIAHHLERANETERAAAYAMRAAQAAFRSAAFGAALGHLDRALLGTTDRRLRFDLVAERLNVLNAMGRRAEQAEGTAALMALADEIGNSALRARAIRWRCLLCVVTGHYLDALAAAGEALPLAEAGGDTTTTVETLLDSGQAHFFLAHEADARRCFEASIPLADALGRPDLVCVALNRLNSLAQNIGDYVGARRFLQQALDRAQASANRRFHGALLGNLGVLECRIGHHRLAHGLLMEGLTVVREIGDRGSEAYPLVGLASVAVAEGRAADALAFATQALCLARDVADRGCQADGLRLAGAAHAALGQFAEALACLDRCEAWERESAPADDPPPPLAARAEALLAAGRLGDALPLAEAMAAWLAAPGRVLSGDEAIERHVACGRIFAAAGRPADARHHRACAEQLFADQWQALPEDDRAVFAVRDAISRELSASAAARPEPDPTLQ